MGSQKGWFKPVYRRVHWFLETKIFIIHNFIISKKLPSCKLTLQSNIPMFNRKYIFKRSVIQPAIFTVVYRSAKVGHGFNRDHDWFFSRGTGNSHCFFALQVASTRPCPSLWRKPSNKKHTKLTPLQTWICTAHRSATGLLTKGEHSFIIYLQLWHA